jgi:GNAT superfamily N-acetyltransferase
MYYADLTETSIDELHGTFLDIYGDYKIKLNVTRDQFKSFLIRCCYSPEMSLGGFEGNRLIGFQIVGEKRTEGRLLCYNAAAGIVPEHRSRFKLAYNHTKCLLSKMNKRQVHLFVYEILVENKSALKIMLKFGANIRRQLITRRKETRTITGNYHHQNGYQFHEEDDLSFLSNFEYNDDMSSWQNSIYAINRMLEDFSVITIRKDKRIVGFGTIHKMGGDIPQFYVEEKHRRKGIGSMLLSTLAGNTRSKYVSFLNADVNNSLLSNFLKHFQFQTSARSYEMVNYF